MCDVAKGTQLMLLYFMSVLFVLNQSEWQILNDSFNTSVMVLKNLKSAFIYHCCP